MVGEADGRDLLREIWGKGSGLEGKTREENGIGDTRSSQLRGETHEPKHRREGYASREHIADIRSSSYAKEASRSPSREGTRER